MKRLSLVFLVIFSVAILPSYGQYNYSPPNKYLKNPYAADDISDFKSNALRRAKNTPPTYRTVTQYGFVVLLDSTKILGNMSLYGRCYDDLYGVIVRPSESGNGRKSEYILNKSSLLAFGLMDRSENATPEQFEWEKLTAEEDRKALIMGTYNGSASPVERQAVNPDTKEPIPNMTETVYVLKNTYPHLCEVTKLAPGYVLTASGERLEGYIQLDRIDSLVVEVRLSKTSRMNVIRTEDNVAKIFGVAPEKNYTSYKPYQLLEYGSNESPESSASSASSAPANSTVDFSGNNPFKMIKQARAAEAAQNMSSSQSSDLDDKTMRPAVPDNPWNLGERNMINNLPMANNTAVNETSEENFAWRMASGTGKKNFEKSQPIIGYVKLKSGELVKGELKIKRMNTKEFKYFLDEFEIKNDDGKFSYTQQEVVAYGAGTGAETGSGDDGGVEKIKPGDIVQGFIVAENPQLIITGTMGGYKTEPKSGYVQLADGTVNIGLVSERKTFSGRVDVTISDFESNEIKYKGLLLSHGYFDIVPFSEYPSSVYSTYTSTEVNLTKAITVNEGQGKYTDFATGYLRLIDGTMVYGKFASGIPGVTARDDAEPDEFSGSVCVNDDLNTPVMRPTPPINKFFNDRREKKLEYTTNSELLDEIYFFKIKTEDGKKEFRNDLVKAYGANGIFISQLTKNGLVSYEDEKRNFHKGNIITKKGENLEGWIAHIARSKKKDDYYGIYFTQDQNSPVTVYLMDDLEQVNQKIVEIEAYDPLSEDFLAAKEMSSTFESHENGIVVDQNGTKKSGNITLEIPPKLWYGTSLILTDNNGVQEIFDRDNPIEMAQFSKGDSTFKYIMYRGVFVQVLKESGPLYYFRNPFPSIEKNSGKFLNNLINSAIEKGQQSLANDLSQGLAKQGDIQSAATVYDVVANADGGSAIDLGIYLKEYLVYYKTIDRGYLVLRKDLGSYTNYAEFDDLANGSVDYLNMSRKEIKALGDIEEYETGEGLQPTLDFLSRSFTTGSR